MARRAPIGEDERVTEPELTEPVTRLVAHLRLTAEFGRHSAPKLSAGWRYRSWAALVLAHGRLFDPVPAGEDPVPSAWREEPGRCYIAAATWALGADLPYVEGWAATDSGVSMLGTEHAWVAGDTGEALDPTWRPGQGVAYIGVPFTPAYRQAHLRPALLHPGSDGEGLALLRDGIPADALAEAGRPIPEVPEQVLGAYTASWLPDEAS
jgi:hypothetical protein